MNMPEEYSYCSRCKKVVLGIARYCCMMPYCDDCSSFACKVCHNRRVNEKIREQNGKDLILCANCNLPTKEKDKYYFEGKCQQYYCHKCLMMFYKDYCKILKQYEQNFGRTLEIQVELKCGCEVQRKDIVDFLRIYCEFCGLKNEDYRCIELANQCKIMLSCYKVLSQDAQNPAYPKQKRKELTDFHCQIISEIVKCEDCKSIIEKNQFGVKAKGKLICLDCQNYYRKRLMRQSQRGKKCCCRCKNQIQFANNDFSMLCKACKGKELVRRKCEKCKKVLSVFISELPQSKKNVYCQSCEPAILKTYSKSFMGQIKVEAGQRQSQIKIENKRQKEKQEKKIVNSDFNALECKLCFNAESNMMNKACRHLMMCEQCFKVYNRKHQGAKHLPCPLCNTLGEYSFYIAPIFS